MVVALLADAQTSHLVRYRVEDKDTAIVSTLRLDTRFANKQLSDAYLDKLRATLQAQGFMAASIDNVQANDSVTTVHLYLGDKYSWASIQVGDSAKAIMQQAQLPSSFYTKPLSLDTYGRVQQRLLDYFEDSGYPFAEVSIADVNISGNTIAGNLQVNKGPLYKIDSIRQMGPARVSKNFLHHYLDLPRGAWYKRQTLSKINQRLLELPYLQQVQPWDMTMLNTGSLVNLYLAPKKSNQVNVLAGFLPSNEQTGGKLLFTIDANLQLQNAFGTGERIGLIWQQIQPKSPRLNLQYMQPYIFKSSFGIDFLFELYKKDSSFLNLNGQLGLLYMLSANKTARIIIQTQSTTVLDVDTLQVKFTRRLPIVADVSSINIGLDYEMVTTNYRFNPRSGSEFLVFAGAGQKTVKKNTAVTSIYDPVFDFSKIYDTLKLNTYQVRLRGRYAKYFPLGKQAAFKTGVQAGWYQSPNAFRNELFQVGGYRLMRGFDEESIFASTYAVATLEYRYLLGINSNFFAFTDLGWTSNTITNQRHNYLGAGLGLSFETKGGIFNLSYAAGKRNDLDFDIRQSKIHFGYVSIF